MARNPLLFTGRVPAQGFHWVEAQPVGASGETPPQWFLVASSVSAAEKSDKTYDLHDLDVLLSRVFASTPTNLEDILQFANRFGCLGLGIPIKPVSNKGTTQPEVMQGESFLLWQQEMSDMLQLTGLWDLVQANDANRLAQHVRWEKYATSQEQIVFYSHCQPKKGEKKEKVKGERPATSTLGHNKSREVIASPETNPELLQLVKPGDVQLPARVYLEHRIDQKLSRHQRATTPRLGGFLEGSEPFLQLEAADLSTALWLELADAVVHNRTYGRCRVCNRSFEISPDQARAHRRFCSDACRVKAYRDRQNLARQIYFEEKKSFAEIAEELDSRESTIRRWIMGR